MQTTKSDQVRQYVREGKYSEALRLACRFKMKISKENQAILQRAHECETNPRFYESLGRNCVELRQAGINLLQEMYA